MKNGETNDGQLKEVVVSEVQAITTMAKEGDGRPRPETKVTSQTRVLHQGSAELTTFEELLAECESECDHSQHFVFEDNTTADGKPIKTGTTTTVDLGVNIEDFRMETRTITLMAKEFDGRNGNDD